MPPRFYPLTSAFGRSDEDDIHERTEHRKRGVLIVRRERSGSSDKEDRFVGVTDKAREGGGMVYTEDLKFSALTGLRVRIPPLLPKNNPQLCWGLFFESLSDGFERRWVRRSIATK